MCCFSHLQTKVVTLNGRNWVHKSSDMWSKTWSVYQENTTWRNWRGKASDARFQNYFSQLEHIRSPSARWLLFDIKSYLHQQFLYIFRRQMSPQEAALADVGLMARITVDSSWSADQMESRLAFLFQRQFVKKTGQRFRFTYLQVSVRLLCSKSL